MSKCIFSKIVKLALAKMHKKWYKT